MFDKGDVIALRGSDRHTLTGVEVFSTPSGFGPERESTADTGSRPPTRIVT